MQVLKLNDWSNTDWSQWWLTSDNTCMSIITGVSIIMITCTCEISMQFILVVSNIGLFGYDVCIVICHSISCTKRDLHYLFVVNSCANTFSFSRPICLFNSAFPSEFNTCVMQPQQVGTIVTVNKDIILYNLFHSTLSAHMFLICFREGDNKYWTFHEHSVSYYTAYCGSV